MHREWGTHIPWPNLYHEPGLLWETSYLHPNPSVHNWKNLNPTNYAMTNPKVKRVKEIRPGQTPGKQILSILSLLLLCRDPMSTWAPFLCLLLSLMFQQEPSCLWRCHISCLLWPSPFVSFILLALWTHWEKICICSPHFAFVSLLPSTLPVWFLLLSVRGFLLPNI